MKSLKNLSDVEFQTLFPILEGLALSEIECLRCHMSECPFKRCDVLMKQGERGHRVLFLAYGRIKIVTSNRNAQTVISFCGRGELLGEINALTPGGHSASVIADQACFAWSMTVEDFLHCLADMPHLSLNISKLLAHRTRKATEQLHIVATMPAEQRVAYNLDFIIQQARTNVSSVSASSANGLPANSPTTPSVTIADLSSMSGCSSKHVHRALTKLREVGLIEQTKGRVHVLDPERLKAYALGNLK